MSSIKFLDTGKIFTTHKEVNTVSFKPFKNPLLDSTYIESITKPYLQINKLELSINDSLNYQSSINAFPSTLPEEIKIKFIKTHWSQKINPFYKDDIAKANIENNTIYLTTDLLAKPKNPFLISLSNKISKQELIDHIFYHEFAHIIFTHHFKNLSTLNAHLSQDIPNLKDRPLYQAIRNLEENFTDGYDALLNKNKHHHIDVYSYFLARQENTQSNTKGFYFNINSLSNNFNKISNFSIENPIDDNCNKLFKIALESTIKNVENNLNNDIFKQKLQENLARLGYTNNILKDLEKLIENPQFYTVKTGSITKRMFCMRQEKSEIKSVNFTP